MRRRSSPPPTVVDRQHSSARRIAAGLLIVGTTLTCAFTAGALQQPDAAYVQSFEKWKTKQIDDLKQKWLVLAGLFWLSPGENTFGAAADNSIVLPSGPARAGSFILKDHQVSVEFQPGTAAKIDNKVVSRAALESDVNRKPTMIELGSLRMFVISRGTRLGLRVRDLNSAAARNYKGPIFFPLDLDYRVTANFVPSDGRKVINIPDVLGDVTPTPIPGEVHFKLNGQEFTLTALDGDAAHGLSFVIADLTSKTETYPGGRFLDTGPVVDGKVVLDFNRAYNPPCAVTPYATCPLAPKENRLPAAIRAGEKYDRSHGHR